VVESPGVRLAYRLPIDAASGWVSATMAAVCIVWGILAVVGAVQILGEQVAGQPPWLLTLLMAALALASVWILAAFVRQILRQIAVGTTRLEVSDHPFYPGRTYRGFVSQAGRLHVRWFQVQLNVDLLGSDYDNTLKIGGRCCPCVNNGTCEDQGSCP
jgi:hypothetical protein